MNLRHPFLVCSLVALLTAVSIPGISAEPAAPGPKAKNVLGPQVAEELIGRLEALKWNIPKPVRAAITAQCCDRLAANEAAVRRQTCVHYPLSYVAAASRLEIPLNQEDLAKLLEPLTVNWDAELNLSEEENANLDSSIQAKLMEVRPALDSKDPDVTKKAQEQVESGRKGLLAEVRMKRAVEFSRKRWYELMEQKGVPKERAERAFADAYQGVTTGFIKVQEAVEMDAQKIVLWRQKVLRALQAKSWPIDQEACNKEVFSIDPLLFLTADRSTSTQVLLAATSALGVKLEPAEQKAFCDLTADGLSVVGITWATSAAPQKWLTVVGEKGVAAEKAKEALQAAASRLKQDLDQACAAIPRPE